jgi:phosphate transport system permease protein
VYAPNTMSIVAKAGHYGAKLWAFLTDDPRESNTEGGVFPAIFGTVMMVMIMAVLVTPLGVLAAFYLREYARQGVFVSTVRIAVNNLAGVPSSTSWAGPWIGSSSPRPCRRRRSGRAGSCGLRSRWPC